MASTTTATPLGSRISSSDSAICEVRRSWTWLAVRDVGDVGPPHEGQQVVLAEAVELDVLDDHHLVVGDVEEGVVQDLVRVLVIAPGQEAQRLRDAARRADQAVAARALAQLLEDRLHQRLHRIRGTHRVSP
jgi:hypothetical protein